MSEFVFPTHRDPSDLNAELQKVSPTPPSKDPNTLVPKTPVTITRTPMTLTRNPMISTTPPTPATAPEVELESSGTGEMEKEPMVLEAREPITIERTPMLLEEKKERPPARMLDTPAEAAERLGKAMDVNLQAVVKDTRRVITPVLPPGTSVEFVANAGIPTHPEIVPVPIVPLAPPLTEGDGFESAVAVEAPVVEVGVREVCDDSHDDEDLTLMGEKKDPRLNHEIAGKEGKPDNLDQISVRVGFLQLSWEKLFKVCYGVTRKTTKNERTLLKKLYNNNGFHSIRPAMVSMFLISMTDSWYKERGLAPSMKGFIRGYERWLSQGVVLKKFMDLKGDNWWVVNKAGLSPEQLKALGGNLVKTDVEKGRKVAYIASGGSLQRRFVS